MDTLLSVTAKVYNLRLFAKSALDSRRFMASVSRRMLLGLKVGEA